MILSPSPRRDYGTRPQLYNLDAVAYESVMLGLFSMWRGERPDREKPNDVCVGFSRDGWNWTRPDRRAFIPVSETYGDWNYSNVQSVGGGCLVMGDELQAIMDAGQRSRDERRMLSIHAVCDRS